MSAAVAALTVKAGGGAPVQTGPAPRTAPPDRPGGRRATSRDSDTRPLRGPAWPLIAVPAVALATMLWGVTAPAYWGDEADTVSAVSRSLPQLLRMLRHVDAVHGLYYLALWPVGRVLGTGELAMRLPSALAMAAAALGLAAIARRLVTVRAAWCAGLVFAAFPMISAQAHDARPYGMVVAAAVLASYLLIRAAEDPRWRWFAAYGVSLALLGYLELFGLLLVVAHAITLAGLRGRAGLPGQEPQPGRVTRRWVITVALATGAVMPIVVLGWQQRAQIAWIAKPNWHDVLSAVVSLGAGSAILAVVTGLLAAAGLAPGSVRALPRRAGWAWHTGVPRPAGPQAGTGRSVRRLAWLAVPWLALPPALLLAASEIKPVYNFRYLVFCLPAVALLAGAGLAAFGLVMRSAVVAVILALVVPTQLSIRVPGTGMRSLSQYLAARERPGDAVIYPGAGVPPWYLAYPDGLGRLRDIWMARSGPATSRLYGVRVTGPVLRQRERGVCRIWAVDVTPPWPDPAVDIGPGFRLVGRWQPQPGVWLWLYQRPGCTQAPGTAR
jgi:mannosyltransferase